MLRSGNEVAEPAGGEAADGKGRKRSSAANCRLQAAGAFANTSTSSPAQVFGRVVSRCVSGLEQLGINLEPQSLKWSVPLQGHRAALQAASTAVLR